MRRSARGSLAVVCILASSTWLLADRVSGAAVKVVSVPELYSRQRGYFVQGRYGQALWVFSQAHRLAYPVSVGSDRFEAGAISFWLRLTRPRWTYDHQRLVELSDGVQTIGIEAYSGHPEATKLRPRSLRVAIKNVPERPKQWFHANTRLAENFHEQFHHVLFTWRPGASSTYLDGVRVGHVEQSEKWLAPLAGNDMTLSLVAAGAWFDDMIVLRRHLDNAAATSLFERAAGWAPEADTSLHLALDGELQGRAVIPADGAGLAFRCYTETTDNHFLADDPLQARVRLVNFEPLVRNVRLQATVRDLGQECVAELSRELTVAPRGVADAVLPLQMAQRGLFWADLRLADDAGRELAAQRLPFAVTLGPDVSEHPAVDIPNGMVVSASSHAAPGQKWAGFEYLSSWRDLEYAPGKWDFSVLDMVVDEAVQAGLEPHVMFYGCPDWQSTGDPTPAPYNRRQWAAPRDDDAWVDYVRRMAERCRGKIRTYEVWNEPYWNDPSGGYFYGTAERYAELVCLAADRVHAVDPEARVVCGLGGPRSWWEKVIPATAGKADLYGTHPYHTATQVDADEKVMLEMQELLAAKRAHVRLSNTEVSDKQLWGLAVHDDGRPMTAAEFDAIVRWDGMPEYYRKLGRDAFHDHFTSAAMLVRSHALSLAGGCEYILWWTYAPNVPGTTFASNTPSLQSVAYANFAGVLAGYRYRSRLDLGADYLKAYLFEHGSAGTARIVAWTDDQAETVHLDIGSAALQVLDLYGNPCEVRRWGPVVSLPLTSTPLYLLGLASVPQLSRPVMSVSMARSYAVPGEKASLQVALHNPLTRGLKGTLAFELPEGFTPLGTRPVDLAAGHSETLSVDVMVPGDIAGSHPLTVTLSVADEALGTIVRRLMLPVRLQTAARTLTGPVHVDGDLGEWGDIGRFPIRIDRPQQVVIGTPFTQIHDDANLACDWKGTADLSLSAAVACDADAVYLALRVWDDARVNTQAALRPPLSYEGDCIEVFIDGRPPAEQGKPAYDERVFHLMVVPPVASFPAPMLHLSKPRHGKLKAAALDAQEYDDGYAIEVRIPWSNLPDIQREAGTVIGFDIGIDDADDSRVKRRKSQLFWAGDGSNHRDASVFGRLRLE